MFIFDSVVPDANDTTALMCSISAKMFCLMKVRRATRTSESGGFRHGTEPVELFEGKCWCVGRVQICTVGDTEDVDRFSDDARLRYGCFLVGEGEEQGSGHPFSPHLITERLRAVIRFFLSFS